MNAELLTATLYFSVNKKRKKTRRQTWRFSEELSDYAVQYLQTKRGSYFKPNIRRKTSVLKRLKRTENSFSRKKTYLDLSFDYAPAIRYNPRYKYKFKEGNFYELRKKSQKKKIEIAAHTYRSLAELILARAPKTGANRFITSKVYEEVGIAVQMEQKAPNRMPHVKIFWIVGGYRLARLIEE